MMEATSGEFFGIGVVIDNTRNSKDKQLIIIDTIPDGPADKAGLKPFDKIVEIEGKALKACQPMKQLQCSKVNVIAKCM